MEQHSDLAWLPQVLLPWYEKNKRELPWREDRDPYHIWVSEIMLQQTRVEAVKGYYSRFIKAFPTVEKLANASQESLDKLWEGLGYYSRVRNLKKAAQRICSDFDGCFPEDYNKILSLPGIGPYTAGAITSIAFNKPMPAVDGNVLRVYSRLMDDATPIDIPSLKKSVEEQLREVYPPNAGEFTQAIMELGATVCGPNRKPDCASCPCCSFCRALRNGTTEQLPVKTPKRRRRVEEKTVFILRCDDEFALEKREDCGLLAGLWQFPNVPGKFEVSEAICEIERMGIQVKGVKRRVERKHIFTHVEWKMTGIYLEVMQKKQKFKWFSPETIRKNIAFPTAFRQFWDEIDDV